MEPIADSPPENRLAFGYCPNEGPRGVNEMTSHESDRPVLIIDDFVLTRQCLATCLSPHYSDVRTAWDVPSLFRESECAVPPLILLNFKTRDSANLMQICLDLEPEPKLVVYGLSDEWDVMGCAEGGAAGLHLTTESFEQLLTLVDAVAHGRAHCSTEVSSMLLGKVYSSVGGRRAVNPLISTLTDREAEILQLIEDGMTNQQIANRLSLTVHTVKNHVHSVLGKLGVTSRAEASRVSRAIRYAGNSRSGNNPPVIR